MESNIIRKGRRQKAEGRRWSTAFLLFLFCLGACAKPTPLTAEKAEQLLRAQMFDVEPAYAEVPQRVSFGPRSPKDDYDEKAVATLKNLEKAGLVTIEEKRDPDGTVTYTAKTTKEGFAILGTIPSSRGPAFRARIAEKKLDGVRNFQRHPNQPTVGRAEMAWHYQNPTRYYDMFETKINKPLNKTFVSLVSFYWEKGAWRHNVTVLKTDPSTSP